MTETRSGFGDSEGPPRESRPAGPASREYWYRRLIECILSGVDLGQLLRICLLLDHLESSETGAVSKRVQGAVGEDVCSKYVYIESVFSPETVRKVCRQFGGNRANKVVSYATICAAIETLDFSAIIDKRYLPLDRKSPVIPFLLVMLYVRMASPSEWSVPIYYAIMSARNRRATFEWRGGGSRIKSGPFLAALVSRRLRFEETCGANIYFNEMFESSRLQHADMKKAVMDALCEEMVEEEEQLRTKVESKKQSRMVEESFASIRKYLGVSERMVLINVKFLAHPHRAVREEVFREENVEVLIELVRRYSAGELKSREIVEGCLRLFVGWMKLAEESAGAVPRHASIQDGGHQVIKVIDRSATEGKSELKSAIGRMNGLIVSLCQKEVNERLFVFYSLHWGYSLAILDQDESRLPLALFKYYLYHALAATTQSDHFAGFLSGLQGVLVYAPEEQMLEMVEALLSAWDRVKSKPVTRYNFPTLPTPFDANAVLSAPPDDRAASKDQSSTTDAHVGAQWTEGLFDLSNNLNIPPLYHRIHLLSMFQTASLKRLCLYGTADQGLLGISSSIHHRLLAGQPISKLIALIACCGMLLALLRSNSLYAHPPKQLRQSETTFHLLYLLQYMLLQCTTATPPPHPSPLWRAWRQTLAISLSSFTLPAPFLDDHASLKLLLSVLTEDVFAPSALPLLAFEQHPTDNNATHSYDLSLLSLSRMLTHSLSSLLSQHPNRLLPLALDALHQHAKTISLQWTTLQQHLHHHSTTNASHSQPTNQTPPSTSSWQLLNLFLDHYFTSTLLLLLSICPLLSHQQTSTSLHIVYLLDFCPSNNLELHHSLLKQLISQLVTLGNDNLFQHLTNTYLLPLQNHPTNTPQLEAFMRILLVSIQLFPQLIPPHTMEHQLLPLLFSSLTHTGSPKLNALTHSAFSELFKSSTQTYLAPYYLKLSLHSFPHTTSHLSLYSALHSLFTSSPPHSPIVPYVTQLLADKIKASQLHPGSAPLAGVLFLLLNSSHPSVLPLVLQHVTTLLSDSPALLRLLYCKLLYKIVATCCDYSRKETLTHWYLQLAHQLGITSKL